MLQMRPAGSRARGGSRGLGRVPRVGMTPVEMRGGVRRGVGDGEYAMKSPAMRERDGEMIDSYCWLLSVLVMECCWLGL